MDQLKLRLTFMGFTKLINLRLLLSLIHDVVTVEPLNPMLKEAVRSFI